MVRALILVRLLAAVALIASLGFTPARVRLAADVEVAGSPNEAISAIAAGIAARGGELVTAPSGARWYVIEEISVSLSAAQNSVRVDASRMRGAGCSDKSWLRYESELFTAIDQLIQDASKRSGISMRLVRRTEPNQSSEPTPTSVTTPAAQEIAPAVVVAHL